MAVNYIAQSQNTAYKVWMSPGVPASRIFSHPGDALPNATSSVCLTLRFVADSPSDCGHVCSVELCCGLDCRKERGFPGLWAHQMDRYVTYALSSSSKFEHSQLRLCCRLRWTRVNGVLRWSTCCGWLLDIVFRSARGKWKTRFLLCNAGNWDSAFFHSFYDFLANGVCSLIITVVRTNFIVGIRGPL